MKIHEEHHYVIAGGGPGGPKYLMGLGHLTDHPLDALRFDDDAAARKRLSEARQLDPELHWNVLGVGCKSLVDPHG